MRTGSIKILPVAAETELALKNVKDVMITLKSVQRNGDQKFETELITEGSYRKTPDGYVITYAESEATGYKNSTTILTTLGDMQVTMQRKGAATSNLIVEKGKKHHCHYGTPYGDFTVGITTGNIKSDLNETGGDLYFKYVIDINSSYVSDNEVFISIK
jgi:uncharacterized beta-barrel protein YwiB (DUF1934 family)